MILRPSYEHGATTAVEGEDGELRCVGGLGCCRGDVRLREPRGIAQPVPRCNRHWQQRLRAYEEFVERHVTHVNAAHEAGAPRSAVGAFRLTAPSVFVVLTVALIVYTIRAG
jgi:hypothetical protein